MNTEVLQATTGMACPRCGAESSVTDSRTAPFGTVRRRRACENLKCAHYWTTYEFRADQMPQAMFGKGLPSKLRYTPLQMLEALRKMLE